MILDRLLDLAQSLKDQEEVFVYPTWGYLVMALAVMGLPEETRKRIQEEVEETEDTMLGRQLTNLVSRVSLKLGEMLAPPAPLLIQIEGIEEASPKKRKRRTKKEVRGGTE